jgi:hypothetical protein
VCNLPELNSRCRITFEELPPRVKRTFHENGLEEAMSQLNIFIEKKNESEKIFTLCSVYNDGSWTLIVEKFN